MNFKRLLKPILVILAILILTLSVSAGDLFSTYDQRIKITIDHTDIDSDLSWFPVTVFLTSSQGEEVFAEFDADEDFDRIAFTTSDGETQLYADCELFDDSEQKAIYHVSKTGWTVSSSTDTDIYLYYDNTAGHNTTYISKSGGTAAQSVWDSNFEAVYHMNDPDHTGTDEIDDDFEDNNLTEYTAGSHWAIATDQKYAGTYSAKASGGEDSWSDRLLTFTLSESAKYIKYDFYWRCNDATGSKYYRIITNPLHLLEGGNTVNTKFSYYTRGGSHSSLPTTTSFVADTWYHIEVYHDTVSDFAMYWIDGNYKGKATDIEASDAITYVQFGNEDTVGDDSWFDDITVTVYDTPFIYGIIVDATSNANHGAKKATGEPAEATGQVGQGQDFDGTDDYIEIANDASLNISPEITIEAIIKTNSITDRQRIVNKYSTTNVSYSYQINNEKFTLEFMDTDDNWHSGYSTTSLSGETIYLISTSYDGRYFKNYIDGSEDNTVDLENNYDIKSTTVPVDIGRYTGTNVQHFDGIIDETRISSTNRSAAWISATYSTLWDTLLSYGSEETGGSEPESSSNILFIFSNF